MSDEFFYWGDVTVKVMARDEAEANQILEMAAVDMEKRMSGTVVLKGIEVDADKEVF